MPVREANVVRQQDDVCRREAGHEDGEHGDSHEDGSRFLEAARHVGGAQGLDDSHVADGGEDEGDEEEDGGEDGEEVEVVSAQLVDVQHVMAGGDVQVRQVHGLLRGDQWHHPTHRQHPHGPTHHAGRLRGSPHQ